MEVVLSFCMQKMEHRQQWLQQKLNFSMCGVGVWIGVKCSEKFIFMHHLVATILLSHEKIRG